MWRRVIPVAQRSSADCGAACLAMVLQYHGRSVPLDELTRSLGAGRDGTSAFAITATAREHGLSARGVEAGWGEVGALPLPAILFWRDRHFVVLEGVGARGVRIVDPAVGRRRVPWPHFRNAYSGIALVLDAADAPDGGRRLRSSLVAWVRRGVAHPPASVLAALVLAALSLAVPLTLAWLLDHPGNAATVLGGAAALLLGAAALRTATVVLHERRALRERLRADACLARSAAAAFIGSASHAPLPSLTPAPRALSPPLEGFSSVLHLLAFAALLGAWHPLLLAAVLVVGLLQTGFELTGARGLEGAAGQVAAARARAASFRRELGVGAPEVKGAAGGDAVKTRWMALVDRHGRALTEYRTREVLLASLASTGRWAGSGLSLLAGAALAATGGTTAGRAVAAAVAFHLLVPHLRRLVRAPSPVDAPDRPKLPGDETEAPPAQLPRAAPTAVELRGAVAATDLTFRYGEHGPLVLRGVTLGVDAGAMIAIAGPSASGKSTLGRLLAGTVPPASGAVWFDGVDARQVDARALRAHVAIVPQEPRWTPGSIEENLRAGDPSRGAAELAHACDLAGIAAAIEGMPLGYHTPLGPGGRNLSGGQRQRLALARALAARPRVLLLDEATSWLDAEAEATIHATLGSLGCTRIVITNRAAALLGADRVYLLHGGEIVECGSAAELLAAGGLLARLTGTPACSPSGSPGR